MSLQGEGWTAYDEIEDYALRYIFKETLEWAKFAGQDQVDRLIRALKEYGSKDDNKV